MMMIDRAENLAFKSISKLKGLARFRERIKLFLELTPGLFWLFFFFIIPTLLILRYSFNQYSGGMMIKAFTLDHYIRAITGHIYLKV